MTVVGMDLRVEDLLRVRQYPVLVPGIVVGQWLALMVVAGVIGRVLGLPHAIAGGVLLVAAAPVATLSNFYTQLARGHLALAVTVTAVSSMLAVAATPLVASLGFRLFLGEWAAFELPLASVAQQTVVGLLLPVIAGMLVRRLAEAWAVRWRPVLQVLGLLVAIAVLSFVVVSRYDAIRDQFGELLGASLLLTFFMLGVGFIVVRWVAKSAEERRALIWGFPARNVAIATLIATAAIDRAEMVSFVAVLFATQIVVIVPLCWWLRLERK